MCEDRELKDEIIILKEAIDKVLYILSQKSMPTKRLLTISEAAQYMGVGKTRFGENHKKYVVPLKNGSHYVIPKEELDA